MSISDVENLTFFQKLTLGFVKIVRGGASSVDRGYMFIKMHKLGTASNRNYFHRFKSGISFRSRVGNAFYVTMGGGGRVYLSVTSALPPMSKFKLNTCF